MTTLTLGTLAALTPSDVRSVYSGKDGACCCGCKGNHRYNSQHVAAASKDRGYEVGPDEVNDRQVAKVLKIVQAAAQRAHDGILEGRVGATVDRDGSTTYADETGEIVTLSKAFASTVVGERLYIVYGVAEAVTARAA
jgi:hypothetical protein